MNYTNIDYIRNLTKEARVDQQRIRNIVSDLGRVIEHQAKKGRDNVTISPNQDSELGNMLVNHDRNSLDQVISQLRELGYDANLIQVMGSTSRFELYSGIKLSISWAEPTK